MTIQQDLTIVNIYAPNMKAPKYMKQLIRNIKELIDSNTIIVGDFDIPLTSMNRSSKQKINKETVVLMNLTNIFRTFHPETSDYTFFSSAHGAFFRKDHMLGHKTSLNKFKKTEIISYIFSDCNGMKLEINHKNHATEQ